MLGAVQSGYWTNARHETVHDCLSLLMMSGMSMASPTGLDQWSFFMNSCTSGTNTCTIMVIVTMIIMETVNVLSLLVQPDRLKALRYPKLALYGAGDELMKFR